MAVAIITCCETYIPNIFNSIIFVAALSYFWLLFLGAIAGIGPLRHIKEGHMKDHAEYLEENGPAKQPWE